MIAYRRRLLCDDWRCPASISCRHHFGRSACYASMDERARYVKDDGRFARGKGNDACIQYEFDRPKKWLALQPGQVSHWPVVA